MGKKGFFATLFLILLLIFLLFPASTGREYLLVPEKIVNLDNLSQQTDTGQDGTVSFAIGDYFGYFTEELDMTFVEKKDYKVSICDDGFVNYPKIPQVLNVQDRTGLNRSVIETSGYPVIRKNKIVIISDSFISLYDLNGHLYWKKEILSIATSLDISDNYVLVGYLDGKCELISIAGVSTFSYRPGGSRIEAVYGVAVSSDDQYISIISGLDPQRFILLENRKGIYKPVNHFELEHEFRRSVNIYFSEDNSMVFFENAEGVNIYNVVMSDLINIGQSGTLERIYKSENNSYYSALLTDRNGGVVSIVTPRDRIVLQEEIDGRTMFFKKDDDRFYIGSDNLIMYLKLVNQ